MHNIFQDHILIVGFGSIGKRHFEVIRELHPEITIGVLSKKDKSNFPKGVDVVFRAISEIKNFKPKLAIICTPAPFHVDVALQLANIGTHLLIEKPIGVNVNDVNNLLKVCKKNNLAIAAGYNLRHLPSLVFFRKCIENKFLGRIYSVESCFNSYMPEWRPNVDYKDSVSARSELGGGVMYEMSHEIDYLRWIFGDITWVNAVLRRQSNLNIDTFDYATVVMGCSNNNFEIPLKLSLDFYRKESRRFCEVTGDKGTLIWDFFENSVRYFNGETRLWNNLFDSPFDRNLSYREQYKNFISLIQGLRNSTATGIDGLRALEVITASEMSNRIKATVYVSQKGDLR